VAGTAKVSLDKLATYHTGVVNAFIDVAGVLAQAIKDCLCDHLLVRCADDDPKAPSKPLYLARIDIRDQEVFNICNFSKRKYVHSFPTVEYWLSVVPILPIVRKLVEAFCCQAITSAFGKATSDNLSARSGLLSPATILNGIAFAREFDWSSLLRTQVMDRAALLGSFSRATVSNFRFPSPAFAPQLKIDTVAAPAILGQPETAAKQLLADNSIVVTGTETFMPGVTDARAILLAPTELKPNDAVTLVVDANNTVVGYKPILAAAPPSVGATGVAGPSIATTVPPHIVVELAKRDAQIAELTKSVTDLNNRHVGALAARDKQIAELSARLDAVARQRPKRPR
jgi:hypothetical protein